MDKLFKAISDMPPETALSEITEILGRLLGDIDSDARERFLMNLITKFEGDKVSSMVNLWLAECMGEGVDPTQMCQTLVNKVAQSKQLSAITDPDLLVLFEDWLEELEKEIQMIDKAGSRMDEQGISDKLGISRMGARFLLSKMSREGKISSSSE